MIVRVKCLYVKVLSQISLVLCQSYCKNKGENNQDVTKRVLVFDGFDKKRDTLLLSG